MYVRQRTEALCASLIELSTEGEGALRSQRLGWVLSIAASMAGHSRALADDSEDDQIEAMQQPLQQM